MYINTADNTKHSKYKYTYYQNTNTIVKTPTHTNSHTLQNTHIYIHTLQNPFIHTPTHSHTHILQNEFKQPQYKIPNKIVTIKYPQYKKYLQYKVNTLSIPGLIIPPFPKKM